MLLIDGYNLLHALWRAEPELPRDFGAAREAMVRILNAYVTSRGEPTTLYFDGTPGVGRHHLPTDPPLRIIFCGTSPYVGDGPDNVNDADRAISSAARLAPRGQHVSVVTDDRELASHCRDVGASIVPCSRFIARLRKRGALGGEDAPVLHPKFTGSAATPAGSKPPAAAPAPRPAIPPSAPGPGRSVKYDAGMAEMEAAMLEACAEEFGRGPVDTSSGKPNVPAPKKLAAPPPKLRRKGRRR